MTTIRITCFIHLIHILLIAAQNSPKETSPCAGEWKSPSDCEGYGCTYKAVWEYIDDSDDILFTISTRNRNKWTGIGFSANRRMPETDAILGLVEETGRFFLMDTWLKSYEIPPLDVSQNIHNMSAWRENGITNLKFYRKRQTGDRFDFQFTDDNCPYLIFPVQGGVFNAVNKRIRQHEITPVVSETKICIKSCRKKPATTVRTTLRPSSSSEPSLAEEPLVGLVSVRKPTKAPSPSLPPTTVRVADTKVELESDYEEADPKLNIEERHRSAATVHPGKERETEKSQESVAKEVTPALYTFEIKLTNASILETSRNASELDVFKTLLEEAVVTELKEKLDVKSSKVVDLGNGEKRNKAIIKIRIEVMKEEESSEEDVVPLYLRNSLKIALADGLIGNLSVDPAYLIFINSDASNTNLVVTSQSDKSFYLNLTEEQLKWLVIIGGVTALVVLVVVQALCMVWRDNRNKKNVVKDKQMVNSHWKDYSATTASSAYCYENFAVSEELDGGLSHKRLGKSGRHNGFGQKPTKSMDKNESSNLHFLNSTMDRHQYAKQTGFGSPPSLYATHDRRDPNRTFSQTLPLQPDFYFMPHQRRYSGEVVRVFVDYNNSKGFRK